MKLKQLKRTHRDYDGEALTKYRDLFEGGERFNRNVARYLIKNTQEPPDVYGRRCELAKSEYVNYSGSLGNYFASWLMTSKLTFKSDPEDVDEYYEDFKEDCDGDGTDLEHFVRCSFIDALIDQCAYWRIEFPEAPPVDAVPSVLADWQEAGMGRGILCKVPTANVVNWKRDHDGFVWIVEYDCEVGLEEPCDDEETVTETWTIWRRDEDHKRYQVSYTASQKPGPDEDVPEIEMPWTQGQIPGIPFVTLELPPELWMMNLVAAPQIANWRKRVGLSWAIDRTCYAMPVFNVKNRRKPPAMGSGYYLIQGIDEKAGYLAPPTGTYDVAEKYIDSMKDEIHRVVQQMARGVDNNAATVGRSGQSKETDDRQTEIVLSGFGACVRDAVECTFDKLAQGRGDDINWSVGGMSTYHVTDMSTFITAAVAAQGIQIPSVTYHREIAKRTAQAQLPDLDESMVQTIANEIDKGVTEESIKPPDPVELAKATAQAKSPFGNPPGVTDVKDAGPPKPGFKGQQ